MLRFTAILKADLQWLINGMALMNLNTLPVGFLVGGFWALLFL
uniref:Uncharacterized protein n=1 Tax=Rhizophora mucronata TaxID=61149 RepID=A0A2P2NVF6_RHIMU